ncbi:MAG: S8 family peptidase [Oscillospiraceae bacterium]|nr:S8 family peptidase [Oscillospiraceae bacterium]
MTNKKYPIIAHGELYIEPMIKRVSGGSKMIPNEYGLAKQKIIDDIDRVFLEIKEQREIFLEEKIMCIRMEPKFEAKSYVPVQLTTADGMKIVGGRKYSFINGVDEEQAAKLYFVRTVEDVIQKLKNTLTSGEKDSIEAWRNQIGSIHSFDLLRPDEKVMGFPDTWQSGTVEIILHPLKNELERMLNLFYLTSKIPIENTKVKTYEDGLTFVSAKCSLLDLENIKHFNPLRAVHPLGRVVVTPVRSLSSGNAPQVNPSNKKSMITVGVFDGGADDTVPLLKGYVNANDCVSTTLDKDCISHGTAVSGVILHGNLAGKSKADILPTPCVSVESYRVLPIQDKNDFELYEAIDVIEMVVKNRTDIKLYNLSFGPVGAIIDDSINRFTYATDLLTYDVANDETNPLFCVAAGNDGDLDEPLNRIQSPADMVNGLGIGAYIYQADGSKTRASYSCIGYGREGAKIKPDFLDFGGSIDHPFVLVGLQAGSLATASGTSLASPLSVNKIGKLMAQSDDIIPHLGRTLLIHNAVIDGNLTTEEQGYGYCQEDTDNILFCDDKKVTILYSGILAPTQIVHLPIFAPNINNVKGIVKISWTITAIVAPYANDPDAYTNNCIGGGAKPYNYIF